MTEGTRLNPKKRTLIISIAIPLAVGALSAFLSGGGMRVFATLNQPPLSPPGWLFPVVWTILYILMGIASYLIYESNAPDAAVTKALSLYGYQLMVNFLWPIFFFDFGWYLFSFFWLILLWLLILECIRQFRKISKTAAWLMVPYLIWVTFAGYLNLGIALLN